MKLKNKKLFWMVFTSIAVFIGVLLLDLLTKHFIFKLIPSYGETMDVLPGFINFVHIENKGAAWGIMAGKPVFLMVVSLAILALFLTFYVLKLKHLKNSINPLLAVSAGLIAGGCIGNFIDRVFLGYVRDFINFQFFNFPVFNFADIAVTFSIVLLVIYLVFIYPKETDSKKKIIGINKTQEDNSNIEEKTQEHEKSQEQDNGENKDEG